MKKKIKILMVAAENDALPNCKVGGIGDAVRDLPPALAQQGCNVIVVTPSYGFLHKELDGTLFVDSVNFLFGKKRFEADIFKVFGNRSCDSKVSFFVIDNPDVFEQKKTGDRYQIYCNDPPGKPFETDATKYAFFCRAVAESVKKIFFDIDCIHLHDWHSAFLLVLRRFHKNYSFLKKYRTVFTIHNLSIQGVRPFSNTGSSLEKWYPDLHRYDRKALADSKWPDCINPMATGIRLSDKVHTVSPSYADEIIRPGEKPAFYGGEGLEKDLSDAKCHGRLFGILNGCDYSAEIDTKKFRVDGLLDFLKKNVLRWSTCQQTPASSYFLAHARLSDLRTKKTGKRIILTSVSRVVEQKFYLMKSHGGSDTSALQRILEGLKGKGIYILLGTGDKNYEKFFMEMSCDFENFVFLNNYSDKCAQALYASGHLFLMPSLYEPCGISQMISMRYGQPCLVHETGGLKDTVRNKINGFTFDGKTVDVKVDSLIKGCLEAVEIKLNKPAVWKKICNEALQSRFLWKDSARQYIAKLYT